MYATRGRTKEEGGKDCSAQIRFPANIDVLLLRLLCRLNRLLCVKLVSISQDDQEGCRSDVPVIYCKRNSFDVNIRDTAYRRYSYVVWWTISSVITFCRRSARRKHPWLGIAS